MSKYFQEMVNNHLFGVPVQQYLNNRTFLSSNKQYIDFCSTNYLGIDYREELFAESANYLKQWGSLTQWSRLEADCIIFKTLEKIIGSFVGSSKVLLSHTISNGCTSNIPAIVGKNALMICDKFLHPIVKTGCELASLKKSKIVKFDVEDLNGLETILKESGSFKQTFIFVDGVHSLVRYIAPVKDLQYLVEKYNSWLFIDDAHGFGILGENPSTTNPWGSKGNGVVKYCGGNYNRTFYTSSFGKAFCTHTAFTTIPEEYPTDIHLLSDQYIYSAPLSPSLIGMVHAALNINAQEGETIRNDLRSKIEYFIKGLSELGVDYHSVNHHPAIHVICGDSKKVYEWQERLLKYGIFTGIRVFPLTPKNECGFRFAITAANTYEQINIALRALEECKRM